jgi:hypothetical protein
LAFIWEQLEVSKQILEKTIPKALVVCNTKARLLLEKDKIANTNLWMDYDFGEIEDDLGTFRMKTKTSNLYNVPIFFSSMLTGQRALDNGSYERLKWQIKRAL